MMSSLVIPALHSLLGLSMMIVSIMLRGELSVAVLALPAFPSTLSTSGTVLMILSCTCMIRLISVLDTSGRVTGMNKMLCSSKGGINSVPILLNNGMAMIKAMMFTASVVFLHFNTFRNTGSYILSRKLLTGFLASALNFPFIKKDISTGARVNTRMASTIMMKVLVNARG